MELGIDPSTGHQIVAKNGRYGPYVTEVLPEDAPKSAKPRTSSLFKSMSLDTIDLDQALPLLTLPREVGVDPETGEVITAQNGRYGPYLKKGTDSRSIDSEEQLLTITLDEALAIYAQPKQRGRRAAAPPLAELGRRPRHGAPDRHQGRAVRSVRHRRRDQRHPAPRRRRGDADAWNARSSCSADKRAKGPGTKKAASRRARSKKRRAKKTTAKKAASQEDGRQEDGGQDSPSAKKTAATVGDLSEP